MKSSTDWRWLYLAILLPAIACAQPTTGTRPVEAEHSDQLRRTPAHDALAASSSPQSSPEPTQSVAATPGPTSTKYPGATPTTALRYVSPLEAGTPMVVGVLPKIINVLLIGSDFQGGDSQRTDTLILVSIQPAYRMVTLISFPRDLYLDMPRGQTGRINGAFHIGERDGYPGGGFGYLKAVFARSFRIEIDHVAMLDFSGFRASVDQIGGLNVPLACPFTDWKVNHPDADPDDENNWSLHTIGPGMVHMDGDLALWYARSRSRSSDFDRSRRQQVLLRAAYQQALQMELLPHLPELFDQLQTHLTTDISLAQLLQLAPMTVDITASRVRSYFVQGPYVTALTTEVGNEVLIPDPAKLGELFGIAFGPPDAAEIETMATRIELWNWSPDPSNQSLATERLTYASYQIQAVPGITSDAKITLLYRLNPGLDPARDQMLINLLGLEAGQLRIEADSNATADYRLILGADFNPCSSRLSIER